MSDILRGGKGIGRGTWDGSLDSITSVAKRSN